MLLHHTSLTALPVIAIAATTIIANAPNAAAVSLATEAFADNVVSYQQGDGGWNSYLGEANSFDERWQVNNPSAALGRNNWTSEMTNNGSEGQWDNKIGVSLGKGGSLTVEFTDNFLAGNGLVGNDLQAADLWIFEIGGIAEKMLVEIGTEAGDWYELGTEAIVRDNAAFDLGIGMDIDGFLSSQGLGADSLFSFVRITDSGDNTYKNFKAGADIDAIAALSSVSRRSEVGPEDKDVPEPGLIFALGAVGVGTLLRRKSS